MKTQQNENQEDMENMENVGYQEKNKHKTKKQNIKKTVITDNKILLFIISFFFNKIN